jgi:site-specific DNA-methyltransferase (adenine-specific)
MINKVIQGDCLEVMKGIPNKSIDLIITDPPYGMNFQSNHRKVKHKKIIGDDKFPLEIFDELFRIAKRGVYVFCRWDNLKDLPKPKSVIAWVKNNWSMGDLKHEHGRQWECIAFYNMEEHQFIKRIPDVIQANRTGNKLHPTEKPVCLIEKIIACNVGDTILDPFAGSGTTGVACKNLGRNYILIEKEPEYIDIINKRLDSTPNNKTI